MKRLVFPAMGTRVDVTAPTDHDVAATRRLFASVERSCSRFLPESELSRINADSRYVISISPLMACVLAAASHARTISDGLVDAGIGGAVVAWGYDRSFSSLSAQPLKGPPGPVDGPEWSFDGARLTRAPGTAIDLGGIAKGWACDLAVETGCTTVVSAGGDVRSADIETVVDVVDPWGERAATVPLGVGALATSSVARRRWRVGDREANHLIDPRTMCPADGPILSATAITATAVEAETAAKSILLLGAEGLAWADRRPWIRAALVVWTDGTVYATTGLETAA